MDWRGLIALARQEEKAFKARATAKRKEWLECRRKKDWLGALKAKDREDEYRRSARERRCFIDQNKHLA